MERWINVFGNDNGRSGKRMLFTDLLRETGNFTGDPGPDPQPEPGLIPTFHEDFHNFRIADGQDKKAREVWLDSWQRWGVRRLKGNDDDGDKRYEEGFTHRVRQEGLDLQATAQGNKFVAGMISTEVLHAQVGGAWEIRFRINNIPKGYHLAFWTLPTDGSWPPEIDFLEVIGGDQHYYFNDHGFMGGRGITKIPMNDERFHDWRTIRFESLKDRGIWRVDGNVVRDRPIHLDKPMYFLATWEVNSKWPGPVQDKSAIASVTIDYVKAWRHAAIGELVGSR